MEEGLERVKEPEHGEGCGTMPPSENDMSTVA